MLTKVIYSAISYNSINFFATSPTPIPPYWSFDMPAPTFNKTLVCLDLIDDYTPVRY